MCACMAVEEEKIMEGCQAQDKQRQREKRDTTEPVSCFSLSKPLSSNKAASIVSTLSIRYPSVLFMQTNVLRAAHGVV